jgi:hypothetical protein
MDRKKLASQAEKMEGRIKRATKKAGRAKAGADTRSAKKVLKRAQRKKVRLELAAKGGKEAAAAAEKAAAAAAAE